MVHVDANALYISFLHTPGMRMDHFSDAPLVPAKNNSPRFSAEDKSRQPRSDFPSGNTNAGFNDSMRFSTCRYAYPDGEIYQRENRTARDLAIFVARTARQEEQVRARPSSRLSLCTILRSRKMTSQYIDAREQARLQTSRRILVLLLCTVVTFKRRHRRH